MIPVWVWERLPQLATVFISIVIQALPFVLMAVFSSALLQNLITIEMVEAKLSRTNRLTGIFLAIGAGCFFPVCDCGVVPVVKRLLLKGVPPYMALAFLITAPLVNPITVWATATAFSFNWAVTLIRVAMAVVVGATVALVVSKLFPKVEDVLSPKVMMEAETVAAGDESRGSRCAAPVCCCHGNNLHRKRKVIGQILDHASEEFLEVGKFLVIGALIAALMQTYIPKRALMVFTENPVLSVIIMMVLALVLSLCAEADAFVARSFTFHFPLGSVMGFMVFGQMFDIKNTALLLKNLRPKAVFTVIGLCAALVFLFCSLFNLLGINFWGRGRF